MVKAFAAENIEAKAKAVTKATLKRLHLRRSSLGPLSKGYSVSQIQQELEIVADDPDWPLLEPRPWGDRGNFSTHAHFGASYYEPTDMLPVADSKKQPQQIGLAYLISAFGPVEPTSETFEISLELSMIFKCSDVDALVYKEAHINKTGLQELADRNAVKKPPPIFEISNAQSLEYENSRITAVDLMCNPDDADDENEGWGWYVRVYYAVRARCCALRASNSITLLRH